MSSIKNAEVALGFMAFIYKLMEYCSTLLAGSPASHLAQLDAVETKAFKIIRISHAESECMGPKLRHRRQVCAGDEWSYHQPPSGETAVGQRDEAAGSSMAKESGAYSGEDYKSHFQPREYFKRNLRGLQRPQEGNYLPWALKKLHQVFSHSDLHGHRLLDVGSGPSIYQILSAGEAFDDIYLSDFTEVNRNELHLWLADSPEAFNWSPIIQYVCDLEGNGDTCESKSERLRRKVKSVLFCDVNQDPPVCGIDPPFDCILTTLCLEAACLDIEMYHQAVGRLAGLLKAGGHLVMVVTLEETFYQVGNKRFYCLTLSEATVQEALIKAGFSITVYEKCCRSEFADAYANFTAILLVVAQKNPLKQQ
uniref:nicotinamide N-methyltransferase-like n=1 Tax=Myxine glutinosa TaxID=7769 RepID=UPI00358E6C84